MLRLARCQAMHHRLWLDDGSCVRLRPQHAGHVSSYGFMQDRRHGGPPFRMLTIIDEFAYDCLSLDVDRRLNSDRVVERLIYLFAGPDAPDCIRSHNGSEFTVKETGQWVTNPSVNRLFIEPGSVLEKRYVGSFTSKLCDRILDRDIFDTLREAQALEQRRRNHYNTLRPCRSLGDSPAGSQVGGTMGSGLRSVETSTEGCMTGHSVPHWSWCHL